MLKPTGNAMQPYLDELTTLANEGMSSSAGTRANTLLGTPYKNLWASLAVSDPLFRKAQRDMREEMYFRAGVQPGRRRRGRPVGSWRSSTTSR